MPEVICNIEKELSELYQHCQNKYNKPCHEFEDDCIWLHNDYCAALVENIIIKNYTDSNSFVRKSWFKCKDVNSTVHDFHTDGWQAYNVDKMLMVAYPYPTEFLITDKVFDRSNSIDNIELNRLLCNGATIKTFGVGDVVLCNITDLHRSNKESLLTKSARLLLRILK